MTHADPNYYNGAYVIVWHVPNVTTIHPVTGYDPATHTLYHEDLGNDIYDDRDTFYAIPNHNLSTTSLAKKSGTDISAHLPITTFPGVNFSLELNRLPRPQGDGWAMGAYEVNEAGTGPGGYSSGSNGCLISLLAE